MPALVGTPSDDVPEILATGRTEVTTIFLSMSARNPEGRDAEYIEWHGLDHEAEQHRLPALRASRRLVSTPACRAARAASEGRYDQIDHLMTYFFTDVAGLLAFEVLSLALTNAGRNAYRLGQPFHESIPRMPLLELAGYQLDGTVAAGRIKVGADVLPWLPARGVYVLLEQGEAPLTQLIAVEGVAGAWWGTGIPINAPHPNADNYGLRITYIFLDGDPAETAKQLRPVLEERWNSLPVAPLLAAPFHTVVRHDWGRYLP
jgi:hypothetical protein